VTSLRKRFFSCGWKHWQHPWFSDRFSISWQRADLCVFSVNVSKLRWWVCLWDVPVRLDEDFWDTCEIRRSVYLFDRFIGTIQWSVCLLFFFSDMSVSFGAPISLWSISTQLLHWFWDVLFSDQFVSDIVGFSNSFLCASVGLCASAVHRHTVRCID
jgi:hypothetical protein